MEMLTGIIVVPLRLTLSVARCNTLRDDELRWRLHLADRIVKVIALDVIY